MMSPLVHQKGVDLVIEKDRLDHMRRAAMAQAFSWTQSARSYAAILQIFDPGGQPQDKQGTESPEGRLQLYTGVFAMRRSKPQPIRNKLDLADRTQVRLGQKASWAVGFGADQHRRPDRQLDCGDQQGGGAAKGNHTAQAGRCSSWRRDRRGGRRRAGDSRNNGD
ncbi:hypothetical protein ACVWWG_001180 [Bradyrhizobium sp. LB7.2]